VNLLRLRPHPGRLLRASLGGHRASELRPIGWPVAHLPVGWWGNVRWEIGCRDAREVQTP
jgi:hypothetical protein